MLEKASFPGWALIWLQVLMALRIHPVGRIHSECRYGPVNPSKDQQRENNLKISYISSKEQIGEPYSRYASMLKSSDTIEGNPDINIKLANKYIKIQELDALLSMLGPSQDAKNIRSAAIGVDNLEFLDGVITGIRNLVRTRRLPLS